MTGVSVLLENLGFPESTRWRDGRIWLCNWGAGEVIAVTQSGEREVIVRLEEQTLPFSIDWLPDGQLIVVDGPRRRLLGQEIDGTLTPVADLSSLGEGAANELVVDGLGTAYVNGGSGSIVRVGLDGRVDKVADGLKFPNGMTLIDNDRTLVVADSHAEMLIAYRVETDGTLSAGRVWAELEHAPDGICVDAEGAIWVASVPGLRCTRVGDGGEVLNTVAIDRGCFACMLGGEDGRTLFIAAAVWLGMDALLSEGPGETGQLLAAPHQPASAAGHP